jgi:hypothetical protein
MTRAPRTSDDKPGLPLPDWGGRRCVLIAAAVTTAIVIAQLLHLGVQRLTGFLGDTDDATRLVMVRSLAAGGGWYDQKLMRLQPPYGVYMHWSRLVDGGLAAMDRLFALVMPASAAELAMRIVWPLLWIAPAVFGALLVGRRLRGGAVVGVLAVWLCVSFKLFGQFMPGRVDHHNIQIALTLLAFGGVMRQLAEAPREDGPLHRADIAAPAVAGAATALGLCVGLEALVYHALIAAAFALAWALRRADGRSLSVYGAALGLTALVAYGAQTPPGRWLVPACDAMAVNLALTLALGGATLAGAAWIGRTRGPVVRIALLALAGAATAGLYLAIDPHCLHGPMVDIDPYLRSAWLSHIREMAPWTDLLQSARAEALAYAVTAGLGLAGWLWLGIGARRWRDPAWILAGLLLLCAVALTWTAVRAASYLQWFAAPLIAAAVADLARRLGRDAMPVAVVAILVLSALPPVIITRTAPPPVKASTRPGAAPAFDRTGSLKCTVNASFARLKALPPGLVLSEVDAGAYVIANTPHSALSAPYHRLSWGLLQTMATLRAAGPDAERRVRALGVTYVLDCPAHAGVSDRVGLSPLSLQKQLDAGHAPTWLEPLSGPTEALKVYRVRPAA